MTNPTLLVINDDPSTLDFVSRHGTRAGLQVVTARNGRDGVAAIREGRVDLVVMDLQVAGLSELQLLTELARIRQAECADAASAARQAAADAAPAEPLQTLSGLEREHVLRALDRARGNKKAAAAMLGVSRRAFYRRLERLSLGDRISRRPGRTSPAAQTAPAVRVPAELAL